MTSRHHDHDEPQHARRPEHLQHATTQTVEEVVRGQLSTALGGRRGMVEAAIPTLVFTALWLTLRELEIALIGGVGIAVVLLVIRLVQRSTVQFVVNALFGIGIGWLFVVMAQRRGGDEDAQALAYFLPGILYNSVYAVVMSLTVLIGWPVVGFMVGAVTGELTAWRDDAAVRRLCSRLTWLLVLPCILRVLIQAPIWLAAHYGAMDVDSAVGVLGVLKVVLGWPLQVATLLGMVWLLGRNATPMRGPGDHPDDADGAAPESA